MGPLQQVFGFCRRTGVAIIDLQLRQLREVSALGQDSKTILPHLIILYVQLLELLDEADRHGMHPLIADLV